MKQDQDCDVWAPFSLKSPLTPNSPWWTASESQRWGPGFCTVQPSREESLGRIPQKEIPRSCTVHGDSTGQDSSLKMKPIVGDSRGKGRLPSSSQHQWGEAAQKQVETQEAKRNLCRTHCHHSWSTTSTYCPHSLQDTSWSDPQPWASLTPESLHRARASSWLSQDHMAMHTDTWPPSLPVWEAELSLPPSSQTGKVLDTRQPQRQTSAVHPFDLITSFDFHKNPEKVAK